MWWPTLKLYQNSNAHVQWDVMQEENFYVELWRVEVIGKYENLLWFVKWLYDIIQLHIPAYLEPAILTFISDHQKGILEAIEDVFPSSSHGYYLHHLYENMHKKFKYKMLQELLWKATRVTMGKVFDEAIP